MFIEIGKIFPRLINRLGIKERVDEYNIFKLWESLLEKLYGKSFQEQTKPIKFKNKVLNIGVFNSSVASEVQFRQNEILEEINNKIRKNKIETIKITLI